MRSVAYRTHKVRGIVLRSVKYGDTSLVVSIFTSLFGLQSYIINGARSASKKGSKPAFFQPATLLDMEVYHNSFKQLQRIKEYQLAALNSNIFTDVIKNGVAIFMVELLFRCLREPEDNDDLFAFMEDSLLHLNECNQATAANFPVFFAIHLSGFFGFYPRSNQGISEEAGLMFDLKEGLFTNEMPSHNSYIENAAAITLAEISRARHPAELAGIKARAITRREILEALENYYALHIPDFGRLRSLPVLRELMS